MTDDLSWRASSAIVSPTWRGGDTGRAISAQGWILWSDGFPGRCSADDGIYATVFALAMSSMTRDPRLTIQTIRSAVRADGNDNDNRIKRSIVKMKNSTLFTVTASLLDLPTRLKRSERLHQSCCHGRSRLGGVSFHDGLTRGTYRSERSLPRSISGSLEGGRKSTLTKPFSMVPAGQSINAQPSC